MDMINGYVFLDLTKSNVYAKALKVLGADKPVVIKEGSNAPYFVDSISLDGTNVVITKGGKTITIANDNTITNVGDIYNEELQYISYNNETDVIDTTKPIVQTMDGYSFVDGSVTGFENTYASVCRNGNKLTFVVAGNVTKSDDTPYNAYICKFKVPNTLMEKLFPLYEGTSSIDVKVVGYFDTEGLGNAPTNKSMILYKDAVNNELNLQVIGLSSGLTNTKTYIFRYEVTILLSDNLISE